MTVSICVDGRDIALDKEGYLSRLEDWSADVANCMAQEEGLELTPAHWEIIDFIRDYYHQHQIAPAMRVLVKALARMDKEKGTSRYLYRLFAKGAARQACRYAGIPKPTGCI